MKPDELAGLKHRFAVRSSRTRLADASRATIEQPCDGQATGDQQEHCACPNADGPGSASSPKHDSESEIRAWDADERQEERQSEQKDNRHWASGPFDGPGSASSQGHDSESKVRPDPSGDRKASLQESMRKWAEQASMREDKALDIARKSKAKRQREGGDTHRAWLDQKYLKRTLKRLRQQSSSTAPAPGTASARAASEQPSTLCQTRASNTHPGSARLESKGAASARSFNKDV